MTVYKLNTSIYRTAVIHTSERYLKAEDIKNRLDSLFTELDKKQQNKSNEQPEKI